MGTNWITFAPDRTVVPGTVDIDEDRRIVAEIAGVAAAIPIEIIDRSDERADW